MTETTAESTLRSAAADKLEAELVERVDKIGHIIAGGTEFANRERKLAPEVVEALADAQLFSLFTPRSYGGLGVGAHTASQVVQAIARYDGSAAWVVMITNGGGFYTTRFPKETLDEVWGVDPGARLASVTSMDCTWEPVEGGYVVNGRWPYSSGIQHDDYGVLGNATIQGIIPKTAWTIEETWDTVGLRGTGSHTTVVKDCFVPEHRTIAMTKLMGYGLVENTDIPAELRIAPLEMSGLIVASVIVGLGQAACRIVAETSSKRMNYMSPHPKQDESPAFQHILGEATMRIEAARALLGDTGRTVDAYADRAEMMPDAVLARMRGNVGHAVREVTSALDDLMYLGGAGSFAMSHPLSQVWRDCNTGARHVSTIAFSNYEWIGLTSIHPDTSIMKP